ncbi:unnamed protein product [Rhizophagus irregularis]|uniref:Uncharacterized protein n=1 Tax=Rhizophagus irregularis TaxID=588596 RepID=A0A915ZWW9_9GLOM|nr:unnamed protein product [Rhizophagus irregularis]
MSNTNDSKTNIPKTDVSNILSNMPNTNSNTPKTDVLNALKVDDFDDLNLFLAPKDLCWSVPLPKPMEKRNNNSIYKPALRDNSDYIERDDYWKRKIRSMITMMI